MATREPLTIQGNRDKLHAVTDFLGDQLGSVGTIAAFPVGTPAAMVLDFLGAGSRLKTTLSSPGPYTVTSITGPSAGGLFWLVINNSSGAPQTITWPGNVTWGTNGPPVIPDSETCTILLAWDTNANLVHGIHNAHGIALRTIQFDLTLGVSVTLSGGNKQRVYPGLPYGMKLIAWRARAQDASGSIEFDVRRRADDALPTSGDSICGAGNEPYLSAEWGRFETDLSAWTSTTLAFGDRIAVNVDYSSIVGLRDATLLVYGVQL